MCAYVYVAVCVCACLDSDPSASYKLWKQSFRSAWALAQMGGETTLLLDSELWFRSTEYRQGGEGRAEQKGRVRQAPRHTPPRVCSFSPPLPASMWRAPAMASSLAFLETSMLPTLVQRSPTMPRKRPRKPRRMAVIMRARQPWTYPGECTGEAGQPFPAPKTPSTRPLPSSGSSPASLLIPLAPSWLLISLPEV